MNKITLFNPKVVITRDEVFTSRSTEPKIKETESSGQDIVNYVIEEAKLDNDGNIIVKNKPPFYETTGRSLEWTILKGETKRFPEYVAKYLRKVYPFLEEVIEDKLEETKELEPVHLSGVSVTEPFEAKPEEGQVTCNLCGKYFKNVKALALHLSFKHTENLLNVR